MNEKQKQQVAQELGLALEQIGRSEIVEDTAFFSTVNDVWYAATVTKTGKIKKNSVRKVGGD